MTEQEGGVDVGNVGSRTAWRCVDYGTYTLQTGLKSLGLKTLSGKNKQSGVSLIIKEDIKGCGLDKIGKLR